MTTADDGPTAPAATLRAEHDALAEKLEIRRSVDQLRTAAYAGFAAAITFGVAVKVAWDRWGWSKVPIRHARTRYPILFALALLLLTGLLYVAIGAWRRAQALRREEEILHARFVELRTTLRLDP
jgi:hypothetical protein